MGCGASKRIDAAAIDVYRPPPTSFAVFDVNAIEEPWIKAMEAAKQQQYEKPTYVPDLLLEKLNAIEDAPRSWDEVSKALEELKPALQNPPPAKPTIPTPLPPPTQNETSENENQKVPRPRDRGKRFSLHTLEELEAKLCPKPAEEQPNKTEAKPVKPELKKNMSTKSQPNTASLPAPAPAPTQVVSERYKSVKDNIFIVRDRMEREKDGKPAIKFNPLSDFPEICPPGGADSVVIYTTSLGGVRRTFEDCNKVRTILEWHRFVFDERDVSLHGKFLNELKEMLGEGVSVPRMFIKGRYVGGVDEVVNLNETGRLGRILNWARVERGLGRLACEGCGGARFVPCLDCGGSCKIVVGNDNNMEKQRCPSCNENGLVLCPLCD